MQKLFIFTLTLIATLPTVAMQTKVKSLLKLKQRCYATMPHEDFCGLLNHKNGYPLSPKQFTCKLDTIKKDAEDLYGLWFFLDWETRNLKDILATDEDLLWNETPYGHFHFSNPNGRLAFMEFLYLKAVSVILLGIPLTSILAGASIGSELFSLISPGAKDIAHAIEYLTILSAGTTVATGMFIFFPHTKLGAKMFETF